MKLEVSNESNIATENSTNEDYSSKIAVIPEWCPEANPMKEYENYPEERIWIPAVDDADDEWDPVFVLMARSALTYAQESQGVPNREAMENSCSGFAEQYIANVFHYSGYVPEVALWRLLTKTLPPKLVQRWTTVDTGLFEEGLQKYGKQFFSIKSNLLPHKSTTDLIEFYYSWKRAKIVKGVGASRSRKFLRKSRSRAPTLSSGSTTGGILTRSRRATMDNSADCLIVNAESSECNLVKRRRRAKKVVQ